MRSGLNKSGGEVGTRKALVSSRLVRRWQRFSVCFCRNASCLSHGNLEHQGSFPTRNPGMRTIAANKYETSGPIASHQQQQPFDLELQSHYSTQLVHTHYSALDPSIGFFVSSFALPLQFRCTLVPSLHRLPTLAAMATNASPMAPDVPASISSDSDSLLSDDAPAVDIAALRQAVETAPNNFSAHLALVSAIRSTGADVHALRSARERFADAFPLPSHLWKEWLDDERRIASTIAERKELLNKLFPKALADYMSVELHRMRLELAIDMYAAGEVVKEAVTDAFLHSCYAGAVAVLDGGKALWQTFRAYLLENGEEEAYVLEFLQTNLKGHVFAMERGENVRQECDVFEKKLKEKMRIGEMELGQASEEVVMQFRSYAAYAKDVSDVFAIGVYERCVAVCFLNPAVWLEYIRFCQTTTKSFAYSICHRATRNVPWALEVWACAVLAIPDSHGMQLECTKRDEFLSVLCRVRDHVMLSNDMRGAELLTKAVWTVYMTLGEPILDLKLIETTLTFNVRGSTHWASAQSHAAFVLCLTGHVLEASALMEEVVSTRPNESRWWLAYAKLLHDATGNDANEKVRELFRRAILGLSSAREVELISDAWIRFECGREMKRASTAQRVAYVYSVVGSHLEKLTAAHVVQGSKKRSEMKMGKKTRAEKGGSRNLPKRKRTKLAEPSASGLEDGKKDDMEGVVQKRNGAETDKKTDEKVNGDMETSPSSDGKGPKSEDSKQGNEERVAAEAKSGTGSERRARGTGEIEPRTIFINNLAFTVSEDELRKEFEFAGKITGIRLPRRGDGATRGIAFVEFEEEECVEKALTRHMKPIKGRAVWVRRSKPPPRKAKKARGGGPRHSGRPGLAPRGTVGLMQPRSLQRRVLINTLPEPGDKDPDVKMKDEGDADHADDAKGNGKEIVKPKSQDDFRAMFLWKN